MKKSSIIHTNIMKLSKFLPFAFSVVLAGAMCACSDDATQQLPAKDEPQEQEPVKLKDREEIRLNSATKETANGLKEFYLKFTDDAITYVENKSDAETSNVIVSPLSAAFLLGMSANGYPDGEAEKIAQYLSCDKLSELNNLTAILMEKLPQADNQTVFSLNNSIWINNQYSLSSNFASTMAADYKADTFFEDFNNSTVLLNKINKWGSEKTDGLIPECIKNLNISSPGILVNAMLLKSKWADENKFPVKNTYKGRFNGRKGEKNVDMMRSSVDMMGSISYNDNFTATWINLGNKQFNLFLVLPNEKTPHHTPLTTQDWAELTSRSYPCKLTVELPKFKIENKLSLNDILRIGGLNVLDTPSSLQMFNPAVNAVIRASQSAVFEVEEEGVKAAAISVGEVDLIAPPLPDEDYEIKFNRPFYFFITEYSTQACILSGYITDL
ncbi:MAG: hypothetical protein K2G69_09715 [Muribaculaceae bacterium]|nr:hypothetical protein [Muribaculaceae bacterium]